ncbi:anti-sigma factor family protein [Stigmatella erecta]|uniref:Putative zinc-finger n=1 Tax=Stigmatella erecta TaxID=83460 RepID=A0A1I0IY96_9BACT|nr:zf-HC2 domain-containing protein [Stigmatella erecta]SEU02326.1 Putative zinc-finger [Stigmatella erecta]
MNPHCPEQDLDALLAGELSPAEAGRVRTHAETCATCAQALAWLKLERGWMAQRARRMPARPALNFEALQARLESAPTRPREPRTSPRWAGFWAATGKMALGAAAAVAFLVLHTQLSPAASIEESWTQDALASGLLACEDTSSQEVAAMEARFGACLIASPVLSSH